MENYSSQTIKINGFSTSFHPLLVIWNSISNLIWITCVIKLPNHPHLQSFEKTQNYIVIQKLSFIRNHKVYGMEFKLNIFISLLYEGKFSFLQPPKVRELPSDKTIWEVVSQWIYNYIFGQWFCEMENNPPYPQRGGKYYWAVAQLNFEEKFVIKS